MGILSNDKSSKMDLILYLDLQVAYQQEQNYKKKQIEEQL